MISAFSSLVCIKDSRAPEHGELSQVTACSGVDTTKGENGVLEHQPYDHALKSLMGDRAAEIIPQFLPESEVVTTENIEIKEEILTLHYRVLALWTLDAQEYVKKGIIGMYTFLPGMRGANAALLLQAIEDIQQRYPRPLFIRHLRRFKKILQRSGTVSAQDKQIVEDKMHEHYDSFVDEDPEVQERVIRGKIEALQEMALEAVKNKYPPLVELAQEQVVRIKQPEVLRQLIILIFNAPDQGHAQWLLNNIAA